LAIFIPYAVPGVVATLMWGYLYGPDFGPFAQITEALGFGPPPFNTQTGMLFSIMNIVNWAFIGYNMILIYAALRSIPTELYEAARVDGANVFRQYWNITLPLCRPALGALAALEVVFIYNEFFWATALMQTGDKFPITSALNNLRGEFFVDYNLLSAGSVMIAIPTILVFLLLQRQFVRDLTLGATKG
ncbi:MAG: ABC transporter permease subunit, partial [Mycetocola sp.]